MGYRLIEFGIEEDFLLLKPTGGFTASTNGVLVDQLDLILQ